MKKVLSVGVRKTVVIGNHSHKVYEKQHFHVYYWGFGCSTVRCIYSSPYLSNVEVLLFQMWSLILDFRWHLNYQWKPVFFLLIKCQCQGLSGQLTWPINPLLTIVRQYVGIISPHWQPFNRCCKMPFLLNWYIYLVTPETDEN